MEFIFPKTFIPKRGENVYEPSEDTFLLLESMDEKDLKGKVVLEIGVGSGIVIYNIFKHTSYAYGNDISRDAVRFAKKNLKDKGKIFISKGTEAVKLNNIDVIVFNPPYLPRDEKRTSLENAFSEEECNKSVKEIMMEISKINKSMVFYFIVSSLCEDKNAIIEYATNLNLKIKLVDMKKLFFEEIYCFKVWK